MRAAICDDQPQALEELKNLLLRIPAVKKVHAYSDMENFWAALQAGTCYDVVFMDIDWRQEETGIDFAEKLYKLSPYTKLIYVTAYTLDYVEDALLSHVNLSGFLKKPVSLEQLERNVEKVREEQSVSKGKVLIYYQGSHMAVPFRDIFYLESRLHKTSIILKNLEYVCSEKLESLRERLDDRFLKCHKSYLVNMQYIREFRGREIVLEDGRTVPVSKARAKEAKERFCDYISNWM